MVGMKKIFVAGVAVSALFIGSSVYAATSAAPAEKKTQSEAMSGAAKLETAYKLAAYGREKSDPQALILAAKMMNEVGAQKADIKGEIKGGQADAKAKTAKPETTAASLLDEAEGLARGDAGVTSQIAEVRASAQKGFVGGPRRTVIRLPARSAWTWSGAAVSGEQAIAIAQGDGDTDVDMKVFDGSGNLVCEDVLTDYTPACQWTPAWTGTFSVQLINNGNVYTDTVFVTN
jgi:hypothetical protein